MIGLYSNRDVFKGGYFGNVVDEHISEKRSFLKPGLWNKALAIFLILAGLGALAGIGFVYRGGLSGERFTEFYILGLEGRASGYPSRMPVGEEGRVQLGIYNREFETVAYRVEIKIDGAVSGEIELVIDNDEKWQETVSFTPIQVGDRQKLEFLLYKAGREQPYRELYLWVDIVQSVN